MAALLDSVLQSLTASTLELRMVAVAGWLVGIVLLAIGLDRWGNFNAELLRKVVHIGTGNIILLSWWLQIPAWVGIGASILFSLVTLLSYRFPLIPGIDSVGRKSLGTFFYAVSIGVLIGLFWQTHPQYAAIGVLIMTWGDGLAALIGQRWGQHIYQIGGMQKSWEGSLTMFGVSYLVSVLVLLGVQGAIWTTWVMPLAIALVATTLEAFSILGIDNLTVPIGSAAVGFLLIETL